MASPILLIDPQPADQIPIPGNPVTVTVTGTGGTIPLQDVSPPDQIAVGNGNLPPVVVPVQTPKPGISSPLLALLLLAAAVIAAVKFL